MVAVKDLKLKNYNKVQTGTLFFWNGLNKDVKDIENRRRLFMQHDIVASKIVASKDYAAECHYTLPLYLFLCSTRNDSTLLFIHKWSIYLDE